VAATMEVLGSDGGADVGRRPLPEPEPTAPSDQARRRLREWWPSLG